MRRRADWRGRCSISRVRDGRGTSVRGLRAARLVGGEGGRKLSVGSADVSVAALRGAVQAPVWQYCHMPLGCPITPAPARMCLLALQTTRVTLLGGGGRNRRVAVLARDASRRARASNVERSAAPRGQPPVRGFYGRTCTSAGCAFGQQPQFAIKTYNDRGRNRCGRCYWAQRDSSRELQQLGGRHGSLPCCESDRPRIGASGRRGRWRCRRCSFAHALDNGVGRLWPTR